MFSLDAITPFFPYDLYFVNHCFKTCIIFQECNPFEQPGSAVPKFLIFNNYNTTAAHDLNWPYPTRQWRNFEVPLWKKALPKLQTQTSQHQNTHKDV